MREVSWHPSARRELVEAASFYDGEAQGLGEVFLDLVEAGVERLQARPRSGRAVFGEIRQTLVARFPYGIVYRLDTSDPGHLYVLAIAHLKRRPRYWAKRK